jgi:hypothetical protein
LLSIFLAVLPVFILIAVGYGAVRLNYVPDTVGDALNSFAVKVAVPVLLFRAMLNLDFAAAFSPPALVGFYTGAFCCFVLGIVLARKIFKRRPGEAVSVGFAATFSNSVLLGLAIIERSFGSDALTPAFGIIAFHAPSVYILGMVTMELMRRDGKSLGSTLVTAGKSILANSLMIAILIGAAFNLVGIILPEPVMSAVDMIATAAIPVALVGIGAAMTRYKISAGLSESMLVACLSLMVHPAIAFGLTHYVFALEPQTVRAVVALAAMPPGMNIYIFAVMYDRAVNLAASAFLVCTALSVFTATLWLYVLSVTMPA